MSILTGNEAFAAMAAGQSIECRHKDATVFDVIGNFPATVLVNPEYEFRVALKFMTIGHLDIDVPESIQSFEELIAGKYYYIPNLQNPDLPVEILNWHECEPHLRRYIAMNLLHDSKENAIAHTRAFICLNNGSLDPVIVPEKTEKPKRKSRAQKPTENTDAVVAKVEDEEIETDPIKLVEKFTAQIAAFTKTEDVLSYRHVFLANGYLDRNDQQHLCKLCEDKLTELDPEQYTPKVDPEPVNEIEQVLGPIINKPDAELTVANLQKLQQEAELLCSKPAEESAEDKYQALLDDLISRAAVAATPAEANALVGYTKEWTEEQRKPLLTAISNRLVQLSPKPVDEQPPSLMIQIQNAPDLTTLDALEIDVSARAPEIQPKLMDYVKKRRFELENAPDAVAS